MAQCHLKTMFCRVVFPQNKEVMLHTHIFSLAAWTICPTCTVSRRPPEMTFINSASDQMWKNLSGCSWVMVLSRTLSHCEVDLWTLGHKMSSLHPVRHVVIISMSVLGLSLQLGTCYLTSNHQSNQFTLEWTVEANLKKSPQGLFAWANTFGRMERTDG